MKYLVIRHAATDANRLTRAVFGVTGASLNDLGEQQAAKLGAELVAAGVDVANTPVAVSELQRTEQTARLAGFKDIVVDPRLNEVNTADPQQTLDLVARGKLPPEAITAAKAIIAHPPKERVWVTHGLVIAALQCVLDQSDIENLVPKNCEIREIEL